MAIARPITKTIISTTAWGIPVTDQLNANTTDIAAVKPGAWITPTLTNGWTVANSQTVQYCKINNVVYVRGQMTGGSMNVAAFNLGVGYRPLPNSDFVMLTNTGGTPTLGALYVRGTTNAAPGDVGLYYGGTTVVFMNITFAL